jgi:putative toxin-antitoxin system antitoxin component (TIGR02293 family)
MIEELLVSQAPNLADTIFVRVRQMLGTPRISSDQDLARLVEQRLPTNSVKALVRHGFADAEVFRLVIPRRTLAHRMAKHEALSHDESDRAVRVARISALAEQVFGATESAMNWLRQPKRKFSGRPPMELLETEAGSRLVEELLYQIDDGMFA